MTVPPAKPTTTIRPSNATAFAAASYDGPADRVVHDVRAAAAGEALDGSDDVLVRPIDHQVGPERADDVRLDLAADHADDAGAGRLAQLDGGRTHAARRRVHEQGLPHPQRGPPVQPEPAGLVGDVHRRRRGVVQPGRGGEQVGGGDDRVAGQCSVRQLGGRDDPLADPAPLHALTDRDDHPAQLDAGGERQVGPLLVLAAGEQHVGEVQGGRPYLDERLARTRCGHRELGQRHDVARLPEGSDLPGGHRVRNRHAIAPWSVSPPSMVTVCPVIHAASSLPRKATAAATSAGSPRRPRG